MEVVVAVMWVVPAPPDVLAEHAAGGAWHSAELAATGPSGPAELVNLLWTQFQLAAVAALRRPLAVVVWVAVAAAVAADGVRLCRQHACWSAAVLEELQAQSS
jgi:hypothetical protein